MLVIFILPNFFYFKLTSFEEFFGEDDVFFVYGSERYSQEDFELEEEGEYNTWLFKC